MYPLVDDEPLAGGLGGGRVVVVDDLGEQVRGAIGADQAPRPLFRVILPADRLAGADAEHNPLEVDDLRFATLDVGLLSPSLGERGDTLRAADLIPRSPELNMHHLGLSIGHTRKRSWSLTWRA